MEASKGIGKQKPRAGIRQRSPKSDMTIEPLERGRKLEISHVKRPVRGWESGEAEEWGVNQVY